MFAHQMAAPIKIVCVQEQDYKLKKKIQGNVFTKVLSLININKLKDFLKEIEMGKIFQKLGIGCKIYRSEVLLDSNKNYSAGLIELEKLDGILSDILVKKLSQEQLDDIISQIVKIIKINQKNGITHGDLHFDNIGYKRISNKKIKLYLIDFGFSCCLFSKYFSMRLEMIQVMRSLFSLDFHINRDNLTYLREKILEFYIKNTDSAEFIRKIRRGKDIGDYFEERFHTKYEDYIRKLISDEGDLKIKGIIKKTDNIYKLSI